jgi:hypothetical protein
VDGEPQSVADLRGVLRVLGVVRGAATRIGDEIRSLPWSPMRRKLNVDGMADSLIRDIDVVMGAVQGALDGYEAKREAS